MPASIQLPYRVRWVYALAHGLLLGMGLLAFTGIVGLGGALSVDAWGSGLLIVMVATLAGSGMLSPMQARAAEMNFTEKNLLVSSCSLLLVGAYYLLFQHIHHLRMGLAENAENLDRYLALVPATEASVRGWGFALAGGGLAMALLCLALGALRKKASHTTSGWHAPAVWCMLFSISVLTFLGGRGVYFLLQATH